jgi:hypothetical protein
LKIKPENQAELESEVGGVRAGWAIEGAEELGIEA